MIPDEPPPIDRRNLLQFEQMCDPDLAKALEEATGLKMLPGKREEKA
jgi:hypothetical protein